MLRLIASKVAYLLFLSDMGIQEVLTFFLLWKSLKTLRNGNTNVTASTNNTTTTIPTATFTNANNNNNDSNSNNNNSNNKLDRIQHTQRKGKIKRIL